MAEEKRKLPTELRDAFLEAYKHAVSAFKEANPTQAEQDMLRSNLQRSASENYNAFRTLAELVADDGNNVPVVMAATESRNLAKEVFAKVVAGIAAHKDPVEIIGTIGSFLMISNVGPLNMTMWDKFQQERIDSMSPEKV